MRLFVAAYPSDVAVASLAAALPVLPESWRPVRQEHWHLTLAFFGDVPEDRLANLVERMRRGARRSAVPVLGLAGGGTFPASAGRARVLWTGVTGAREPLVRLADRATAAARRAGIAVDERAYRPHLTIGRARDPRGADAVDLVAALAPYVGPSWPLPQVRLVRSVLGSRVVHETLESFPLGEPGTTYQA